MSAPTTVYLAFYTPPDEEQLLQVGDVYVHEQHAKLAAERHARGDNHADWCWMVTVAGGPELLTDPRDEHTGYYQVLAQPLVYELQDPLQFDEPSLSTEELQRVLDAPLVDRGPLLTALVNRLHAQLYPNGCPGGCEWCARVTR